MAVSIERLKPGEGDRWRSIRLRALADAPYAFGTTVDEASSWPRERWDQQVIDYATFVAVLAGEDVGVARGAAFYFVATMDSVPVERPDLRELIGMWVAPTARRKGVASMLIHVVDAWAEAGGATTLVLDVVASNVAAIGLYERERFELFEGDALGVRDECELRMTRRIG
jgi:GNAT superfamily N-acetyltransferase